MREILSATSAAALLSGDRLLVLDMLAQSSVIAKQRVRVRSEILAGQPRRFEHLMDGRAHLPHQFSSLFQITAFG